MDESSSGNDLMEEILEQPRNENALNVVKQNSDERSLTENEIETSNTPSETETESPNKPVKHVRLPLARIKQIMKMDPDVQLLQQDAIFLVTKATEMFIEFMAKECRQQMPVNKRKTIMKRDVDLAIESIPQLCFLDGALE
ncbi:DNA polymerase epsilon subunit 4 isoform X1 [Euwallacea fornicatus]|uniref:DNA polymerase epsilon subunit 4 isoform X1 n=1 Tax=Euwallacea fornicatus TaxID=995702 RepID=UPI00338FD2FC